jgi:Histidine kinase-, DNA gyrase B-, and HSP90-like ATPase
MSTLARTGNSMPSRVSETRPEVANFQVRRPDTLQFASVEGLTRMAGVGEYLLRRLIAKEVTDNALDERDRVGEGSVSICRKGDDTYIVEDEGNGISQDLDVLRDLFSTSRPMVSGKFLRKPSRGMLGNGLRVMVAAVALSNGTITIESRGKRTTLQPRRTGSTEIIAQNPAPRRRGTKITYTLDDEIIPSDDDDLFDAQAAIDLAEAAGPAYTRLPSPHWLDLDHLEGVFDCIEPNETTVRQLIEQLDGCSGAKAGRIAAPFGKGRTCRSMRPPEIAALLTRMQESARVVKARSLGPIGDVFTAFDAYIVADAALQTGTNKPRASIPVLIEAWANVRTRKFGGAKLMVYCNRTPVVDDIDAMRGQGGIRISGAGLDPYGAMMKVDGGDCDLIVAVTAPHIPMTSLGKAPDLSELQPDIVEALRRAFVKSRNRLPQDPREPKPPREQPPPKPPKPEPYEVSGPLATRLAEEAEQAGVSPLDLLVLSPAHDPFNESKASRRLAEWFVEQVESLLPEWKDVHLRGMYYRCLSIGNTLLPDGTPFIGSNANSALVEKAGKYARHLGLIPFERIIDERAAPPELFVADEKHPIVTDDPISRKLIVTDGHEQLIVPVLDALLPRLGTDAPEIPRQPFRICLIGEKASLGEVLRPIATKVRGEMLLATGEVSEAAAYGIAKRAAADGRPLRVLYFCDFDPAGWQMPISVARKLQAHICREQRFHDLDVRVIRVGLNIDHVKKYNLPDSPIKTSEPRAQAWRERWGCEQVEIDALAALRPDVLDQIARDAVAAYFDFSFGARYTDAVKLSDEQLEWFSEQPAYSKAEALVRKAHKLAQRATAKLSAAISSAVKALRNVVENEAEKLDDVDIQPELDDELGQTIFDSSDDFVTATRKLQNLKALSAAEDEDE